MHQHLYFAGQNQLLSELTNSTCTNYDERGPGDDLKLQFEAVRQLQPEDRQAIKAMLDGMIVKHRTKQIVGELHS